MNVSLEAIIHGVWTRCTSTLQAVDSNVNTERISWHTERAGRCCRQYLMPCDLVCIEHKFAEFLCKEAERQGQ